MLDGLAFLARTPVVRGALLTDLAVSVLSMPVSLFPLVNVERFGNNPRTFGLFLTAIAVGGVIASGLSGAFTRRTHPGLIMLGAPTSWGVALALFGLSPNPWLGLAFLVLAGAADTVTAVSRSTIVQLYTPDAMRGRAGAAEQIIGQAGPDLGDMRGGLIADATSGVVALVSGGLLCVLAVALIGATTPPGSVDHDDSRMNRAARSKAVTLQRSLTGRQARSAPLRSTFGPGMQDRYQTPTRPVAGKMAQLAPYGTQPGAVPHHQE